MRRYCLILFLTLLCVQNSSAQVFCLPPDQPRYPEIAIRAGLSISFIVKFDIVGSSVSNIHISVKDSINYANTMIELFTPAITGYLNRLCFYKDINQCSIIFEYETRPHNSINRDYVEKLGDDKIHIVGRRPYMEVYPGPSNDCYCKDKQ